MKAWVVLLCSYMKMHKNHSMKIKQDFASIQTQPDFDGINSITVLLNLEQNSLFL